MMRILKFAKSCWLLILFLSLIFGYFLRKIECVSVNRHYFKITSFGNELTIVSGPDYIGETLTVTKDTVQFRNEVLEHKTKKYVQSGSYETQFTLPNGMTYKFTGYIIHPPYVRFEAQDVTLRYGYGGAYGSSYYAPQGDPYFNEYKDLSDVISSAIFANLAVKRLYKSMIIYFICFFPVVLLGFWLYIKQDEASDLITNLSKNKTLYIDAIYIKIFGAVITILSSLFSLTLIS